MNTHGKILAALFAALLFAACSGGGLSGTYTGSVGSITFASGKADVKLGLTTREVPYSVKGNKVVLHSAGEGDIVLTRRDDGSLDTPWGQMRHAGATDASHTDGSVTGHTYKSPDDNAMVSFTANRVTMTVATGAPGAHAMTFTAPYTVSGNKITVQGPGGQTITLTRQSDGSLTAEGSPNKLTLVH